MESVQEDGYPGKERIPQTDPLINRKPITRLINYDLPYRSSRDSPQPWDDDHYATINIITKQCNLVNVIDCAILREIDHFRVRATVVSFTYRKACLAVLTVFVNELTMATWCFTTGGRDTHTSPSSIQRVTCREISFTRGLSPYITYPIAVTPFFVRTSLRDKRE